MNDDPGLAHKAPVHPVSAPADTRSRFVELICADPGLLRVEFDALIAANFPPGDGRRSRRPPRRPGPSATGGPQPVPLARPAAAVRGSAWAHPEAAPRRRARQRSPPGQRDDQPNANDRTAASDKEVVGVDR
ncbi:MAG: hypothetical protein QOI36_1505 [Pseudonocardiales bacterium]|nr:hypothetical protein [Pseudonocardiales bacterium]